MSDVLSLLLPDAVVLAGALVWNTASGYSVAFTRTGNLELKDRFGTILWESGTGGQNGHSLIMQADGNLVIYDASWRKALWATSTEGNPGASLVLLDGGKLAIVSADDERLWHATTRTSPTSSTSESSPDRVDAQTLSRRGA